MRDAGAEYDTASAAAFDSDWVDFIMDEQSMEYPKATSQSIDFLVTISLFIGTNWYEVKSHMVQLLATHIGAEDIPLSYTIRDTNKDWEDKAEFPLSKKGEMRPKSILVT